MNEDPTHTILALSILFLQHRLLQGMCTSHESMYKWNEAVIKHSFPVTNKPLALHQEDCKILIITNYKTFLSALKEPIKSTKGTREQAKNL